MSGEIELLGEEYIEGKPLPGWVIVALEETMSAKWTTYEKTFTDLSAAAATNNIELFSLPARGIIHAIVIELVTSFTGGAITAYTVSVGVAGDLAKYASALDVFQAATDVAQLSAMLQPVLLSLVNGTSIKIAATSTGANLNAATAGKVKVHALLSSLPV